MSSCNSFKNKWTVGTVIEDTGKLGIITKVLPYGAMNTDVDAIRWRNNYEISYIDGDVQVIGEKTFNKLVIQGDIKILND